MNAMEVRNSRIKYFDTTKGLLMLFLVWGHMIVFARTLDFASNGATVYLQNTVPFYRAFFMQTFFFITGFCTNWKIPFGRFFVKNLKTIVLPAFIFLPINYFLNSFILDYSSNISEFTEKLISYCITGIPWFLSALFVAKLLYYFIQKYCRKYLHLWLALTTLFILGLFVSCSMDLVNIWSFKQTLVMIPFLGLGTFVKDLTKSNDKTTTGGGNALSAKLLAIASIPYFLIIIIWSLLGLGLGYPAVDYFIDIRYITAPFHVVMAVSGSALVLLFAKKLQFIGFLNTLGQQSLFIYLFHAVVVYYVMLMYAGVFGTPTTIMQGICFYTCVYAVSVMLLYLGCKAVETKYLSWMVGKWN